MRVTLTFDNGPDAVVTPQVLAILEARGIKATFFVLGRNVAAPGGRDLVDRTFAAGHRIGNHTFSHSIPFGELDDPASAIEEVEKTQALIQDVNPQRLFRPFGGGGHIGPSLLNHIIASHLQDQGYTLALWSSVPRDWELPQGWMENAQRDVLSRAWSVVVLHDIENAALQQLPDFLDWLIDQKCEFSQEFPEDCLPIRSGRPTGSIDALCAPAL